eukprot:5383462-Amphidinium_carterae.1
MFIGAFWAPVLLPRILSLAYRFQRRTTAQAGSSHTWAGTTIPTQIITYHPTAIHYMINAPNPQTGKNYRN